MTVAARVVPDSEGAEASLGDVLAAALDSNREMARLAAVLREENARLRAENAEQAAELERVLDDLATDEAYCVRILDAFALDTQTAIRRHDGTRLLSIG